MTYSLNWITPQLAAGSAPMSYEDLDAIKAEGIDAIVNLCGEFCDLHQIEEQSGFEVYYLPIPDECAPDMEKMELALQWLDEALYLKKRVLIHCRHGLGRTGTFVSAYLLRRGLGLRLTEKRLKPARVTPGSYSQWQLLKKYGKQQGELSARPASIDDRETVELQPFLQEYAAVLQEADHLVQAAGGDPDGLDTQTCCHSCFELELSEAVFLSHTLNRQLNREQRLAAMDRAGEVARRARLAQQPTTISLTCPLLVDHSCLLHKSRPLRCRTSLDPDNRRKLQELVGTSSRNVFLALTGEFPPAAGLHFSNYDTVSGRFVQQYFHAMIKEPQP